MGLMAATEREAYKPPPKLGNKTSRLSQLLKKKPSTDENAKDDIVRIPYATLADLPEELGSVIEQSRPMMDDETLMDLIRDAAIDHYGRQYSDLSEGVFAEIEDEGRLGAAAMKRKTAYAGVLWQQTGTYTSQTTGVYNADKITYDTYDKMQFDGQIALALALIKKPIEHVNISVQSSSKKIQALVEWTMEKMYTDLVRDLLMAINLGHACLEKNWKKVNRLRLVGTNDDNIVESESGDANDPIYDDPALLLLPTPIHPNAYTILLDKFGDLLGINVKVKPGEQPIKIKRSKLIFYTHNKQFGNWYGISRMKPAYAWWYWSNIVLQFMIRYLERKASPPVVVRAPIGNVIDSNGRQVNAFALGLKIGNGLISNSVGVLPNVYNKEGKPLWDVGYLMDDQRMNMFIDVLNLSNTMIMRSMLVPDSVATQNAGSSGGSYSMSDAHSDIHLMNEESIIREIESVINNQIVPWIVKYNFAPEERVKCTVKLEKLTLTRKQLLKEIFQKTLGVVNQLLRDGAVPIVLPDLSAIANALEIPMAETGSIFDMDNWAPGGGTVDSEKDDLQKEEDQDKNNTERETPRSPRDRQTRREKIA